jgi:hypothetical protein
MFSRQHYQAVVRILAEEAERMLDKTSYYKGDVDAAYALTEMHYRLVDRFAAFFQRDNPRFDRARFSAAASIGDDDSDDDSDDDDA